MYVIALEQTRLLENGRPDLARLVERVAERNVRAGYDVLSYEIDGNFRYIEVKSSTGNMVSFFITRNELAFLKRNDDRSWLYFVPQSHRLPNIDRPVLAFPNPISRFERDGEWQAEEWSVKFPNVDYSSAEIHNGIAWMTAI